MLEKYLEEIGLSDKEAAVYVSLLSVDHASVLDIAGKTKIKRPTVYVTLESLAKKGLVSETQVGKKTHYQAEAPERLLTFVERQKVVLDEQSKRLKDFIPQLKSIQRGTGERPVVKYFEGREGIASSYEDYFKGGIEGGTAYLLFPKDLIDDVLTESERKKYKELRLSKKIKNKVIYTTTGENMPSDETSERLRVDASEYPVTCDIGIHKDEVRISILGKKLSAVYIKSQDVADTLASLFRLAFDGLKKK
ncbi:BlaI/MecI/CopY family transcriptional regulator [bacterium]|nr:BlaI/MecI/CopY family transcriptional regulator [bacterium]MCI0680221.1 BlaI/MecI/CopY family transcriptional regulator [bacterium]